MAEGTSISASPVDETHDTSPPAFHSIHLNDVSGLTGRPTPLPQKLWIKHRPDLLNGNVLDEDEDEDEDDDEDDDDVEDIYPTAGGVFNTEEDDFVAVDHSDASDYPWYMRSRAPARKSELDKLHPYVQLLSVSDVEGCEKVELAFPEPERSTPGNNKPKAVLLAHILATRTTSPVITNATMEIPKDWRNKKSALPRSSDEEPIGHQDEGSTIAIHSLAVLPEHQDKGLGKLLIKSYIQRIQDAKIADRLVLLAHDHLLPFYTSLGFENIGRSKCTFGGGGWNDLVLDFNKIK
ncbi:acetyltransferase [Microsporum canis CBS 113480]|uniref:Acetyltransferase n=1 Tax=Arthroderma otae (strain ATCC MYA-4605 / CBS 113480) TaxID=554155 RepID=C5FFG2_ARTOC|nr:acetyltransferase [Microsporum canis CBS 113480]EEQ29409.1 acetyltransferase [Microsporum canis CBS 113480]